MGVCIIYVPTERMCPELKTGSVYSHTMSKKKQLRVGLTPEFKALIIQTQ